MKQTGRISERKAGMKRRQKTGRMLLEIMFVCIFCLIAGPVQKKAQAAGATVSVSSRNNVVSEGDTVYVVVNVSSGELIKGFDGYFTYDSRVLQFVTGGSVVHGNDDSFRIKDTNRTSSAYEITYSVKFLARSEGDTAISLKKPYYVYADDDDSSQMSVFYHALNIVVKGEEDEVKPEGTKKPAQLPSNVPQESKKPEQSDLPAESVLPEPKKNDVPGSSKLRKLSIEGVELAPDFSPKIKNYSALVITDEKELEISYKAKDSRAGVVVSGNKNLTEGKNIIKVTVSGTTGEKTVYRISLNVQRTDSRNQKNRITVSKKKGTYYLTGSTEIEVLPVPDKETIPQGFEEVETTIDGEKITSYALNGGRENGFVLIYGRGDEEGLYLYDQEENILMPYEKVKLWYRSMNGKSISAMTDEERTIQSLKYVIGIMAVFCGLMLIIAGWASIRSRRWRE